MNDLKNRLGLLRSELIYMWRPFNRRRLRRFYRPFIHAGALAFDLGAHLGSRSRAFLELGARVIAVEPQPQCVVYLQKRWGGNCRFTLVSKAVGAQAGTAILHINRMNPTISTLAPASWRNAMTDAAVLRERWDHRVEVEVITLNRLIKEYGLPDFCKIDVEGFEEQVLAGLSHRLPALSFEFISFEKARARACMQRLKGQGDYRFNWSLRERLRLESPSWVDAQGVEQMLDGLGSQVISGDIYARIAYTPACGG